MRGVPETYARPDWPRRVAQTLRTLINDISEANSDITALETATDWTALGDYADDTAAATGGVAVGELYRTGSAVKVRVS